MTRYEQLMNKSVACLELARTTKGYMADVWRKHSNNLREMARQLTIEEAEKVVDDEKK